MIRNSDQSKPMSPPVRNIPLDPPELENFVRIYRDNFDGEKAAKGAGYEDAKNIWPELLANEEVQARLRSYRAGVDVPARTSTAVFEHMFKKAFGGLDKVLVPDVITGEIRIDWEEAMAQDAGALEFDQTISDRGGILQCTTRLRKRNNLDALQVVTRNLKQIERESSDGIFGKAILEFLETVQSVPVVPDDPVKRMARINRRGAAMSVKIGIESVEDDDPEP